jgi:hypothetical protein
MKRQVSMERGTWKLHSQRTIGAARSANLLAPQQRRAEEVLSVHNDAFRAEQKNKTSPWLSFMPRGLYFGKSLNQASCRRICLISNSCFGSVEAIEEA